MRVGDTPKCSCGRTRDPEGHCDGSHSEISTIEIKNSDHAKKRDEMIENMWRTFMTHSNETLHRQMTLIFDNNIAPYMDFK